jgi:acyl-coenzyme A synthetase/AMP-(fatty) acid ligase
MASLEAMSVAALGREPGQPALGYQGRWHGWGELRHVADRLGALIDATHGGVPAEVAFVPRNQPASVAALLGLIARGCRVRMVYAFQSPAALARELAQLGASLVVIDRQDNSDALQAALRGRNAAVAVLDGMDAGILPGFEHAHPERDDGRPVRQIEILTSGTTGPPKRFPVGYDMIASHLVQGNPSVPGQDLSALPPTLLYFPLGNITGLYSTLPALLRGQRAVLLERFSVDAWHAHVKHYRPQASGLPASAVRTVLDANIPQEDLSSLQYLGTGAAPVEPTAHREFEQRYGIPILLSYGATEFGGPVASMTLALHREWGTSKFGSVGRALPGVKFRVLDADTGQEQPPGSEGILEVVSPRIGPDWIRTSDIVTIDADGFVFHRGRADGAIMRGGFKLLPETIEQALLLHPSVAAAAVIGIADHRLGQVPVAAVETRPGVDGPDAARLEAHLRQHVYATHIPVAWRFVAALPRTPSLKIDRLAVRGLFGNE